MLSKLASLRDREDGFTLIELLIVVIIIGILAAIALPIFLNQQKAAKDAAVQSDVRNTVEDVQTFLVSNPNTSYKANGTATPPITASQVPLAVSSGDTVHVVVNTTTGVYEIWGYNSAGSKYTASTAGNYFDYNSGTGVFGTIAAAAPSTYDQ